jgi:biotin carboxyl carrier protein
MTKILATYYATIQEIPDKEFKVEILEDGPIKLISVDGVVYEVDYNVGGDSIYSIIMNNKSHGVQISSNKPSQYEVHNRGNYFNVHIMNELERTRLTRSQTAIVGRQVITAEMPGVISKIYVKEGDEVKAGSPLCVLVAMKMENEIRSLKDGVVKEIYLAPNDKVSVGDKMLVVE